MEYDYTFGRNTFMKFIRLLVSSDKIEVTDVHLPLLAPLGHLPTN